jgi:ActR/RegA family two-component response regulator
MIDQRFLSVRSRRLAARAGGLAGVLDTKIVGQPDVIDAIVPCVEMFQAGLSPDDRPAGVFLLLGPTGTGKTRTVEALAEALHGNVKSLLKIDCGEYQMEHEVAKLIGAPPGYLGHRETQPALTQQKLTAVTSEKCGLSLVLFDEIEKAAPSMARLMLGLLDRGILRLGDNTQVTFEKTIVFMTSNLGARRMMREMSPEIGFQSAVPPDPGVVAARLERVAMSAVRRRFSPEFVNRIDHIITYQPLDDGSFAAIVDHEVDRLQRHIVARLGTQAFPLDVPFAARQWLLEHGTSLEYGARELKRTIHRQLTQPIATLVTQGKIGDDQCVRVGVRPDKKSLTLRLGKESEVFGSPYPTVLLVDSNRELLSFLEQAMLDAGWTVFIACTAAAARRIASKRRPHAALINSSLSDRSSPGKRGIHVLAKLCEANPELRGIVMTRSGLSAEEETIRTAKGIALLRKPFVMRDAMSLIRARLPDEPRGRTDDSPKAA